MEKVFASVWLYLEISVAVARTSQSPFPLVAMLTEVGTKNTCPKKEIRLDCCRKSDNNGGKNKKRTAYRS